MVELLWPSGCGLEDGWVSSWKRRNSTDRPSPWLILPSLLPLLFVLSLSGSLALFFVPLFLSSYLAFPTVQFSYFLLLSISTSSLCMSCVNDRFYCRTSNFSHRCLIEIGASSKRSFACSVLQHDAQVDFPVWFTLLSWNNCWSWRANSKVSQLHGICYLQRSGSVTMYTFSCLLISDYLLTKRQIHLKRDVFGMLYSDPSTGGV